MNRDNRSKINTTRNTIMYNKLSMLESASVAVTSGIVKVPVDVSSESVTVTVECDISSKMNVLGDGVSCILEVASIVAEVDVVSTFTEVDVASTVTEVDVAFVVTEVDVASIVPEVDVVSCVTEVDVAITVDVSCGIWTDT